MSTPQISVILSTYNQPAWLEKVLWGYSQQTFRNFEIVIADDGSSDETKTVITDFKNNLAISIQHIWHEDQGFQKCKILNRAILEASAPYLVFSDGDCIPHPKFIESHHRLKAKGLFLSGGYCKLPMALSKLIQISDIKSGGIFDWDWLKKAGLSGISKYLKVKSSHPWDAVCDFLTTRKATWNGCNASGWKEDILAVNGHNEDMAYGGEDRELGERLLNKGLNSKQIVHRAKLLHLDHSRSYVSDTIVKSNLSIRKKTKKLKLIWTQNGIVRDQAPNLATAPSAKSSE